MTARHVWMVAGVLAAIPVLMLGWFLFGRPAPYLSEVRQEPVLVAPIPAEQTRWEERESSYSIVGERPARVQVRYEVEVAADQAVRAWIDAYGDQYTFRTEGGWPRSNGEVVATARSGDTSVVVSATDVSGPRGRLPTVVRVWVEGG